MAAENPVALAGGSVRQCKSINLSTVNIGKSFVRIYFRTKDDKTTYHLTFKKEGDEKGSWVLYKNEDSEGVQLGLQDLKQLITIGQAISFSGVLFTPTEMLLVLTTPLVESLVS